MPPALLRRVDRRADILVAGDSIDGTAGVVSRYAGKAGGSLRSKYHWRRAGTATAGAGLTSGSPRKDH